MSPAPNQWYVEFDGLSYGPFSYAQMQSFVNEGRVLSSSLITQDPQRGFYHASAFPVFLQWLSSRQEMEQLHLFQQQQSNGAQQPHYAQSQLQAQSQPAHTQQAQNVQVAVGQSYTPAPTLAQMRAPELSVFLIMAEIRSSQAMPFLQALQVFGTAQRIGDTVWLVRGTTTAETLRSSLSQTLTKQDRLFVLDCFNNQTSWFNIGADMDTRIRELWQKG